MCLSAGEADLPITTARGLPHFEHPGDGFGVDRSVTADGLTRFVPLRIDHERQSNTFASARFTLPQDHACAAFRGMTDGSVAIEPSGRRSADRRRAEPKITARFSLGAL